MSPGGNGQPGGPSLQRRGSRIASRKWVIFPLQSSPWACSMDSRNFRNGVRTISTAVWRVPRVACYQCRPSCITGGYATSGTRRAGRTPCWEPVGGSSLQRLSEYPTSDSEDGTFCVSDWVREAKVSSKRLSRYPKGSISTSSSAVGGKKGSSGISGKRRPYFEEEVVIVSEAVGHSFDHLDFVHDALQQARVQRILAVGQDAVDLLA